MNLFYRELLTNFLINIIILLFAIYIFPFFTENKEIIVLLITSVYSSSILYSVYSFYKNRNTLWKIIFDNKLNLKKYIESKIYTEVRQKTYRKIGNINPIKKYFLDLFTPSTTTHSIAKDISKKSSIEAWKNISKLLITLGFYYFLYVVVFRSIVAPYLIKDATNLSTFESFYYPFVASIEYLISKF